MTRVHMQTRPDMVTVLGVLFAIVVLVGVGVVAIGVVGA